MKALKISIITIISVIIATAGIGVSAKQSGDTKREVILIGLRPSTRPRVPAMSNVTCSYSNGIIEFNIPANEEYVTFTLGDDAAPFFTGYADHETPSVEIPVLTSDCPIHVTTGRGQEYYGTIYIY